MQRPLKLPCVIRTLSPMKETPLTYMVCNNNNNVVFMMVHGTTTTTTTTTTEGETGITDPTGTVNKIMTGTMFHIIIETTLTTIMMMSADFPNHAVDVVASNMVHQDPIIAALNAKPGAMIVRAVVNLITWHESAEIDLQL